VADFGLARHFDGEPALTLSGARMGTPSYMAPEQTDGSSLAIGPAVDIRLGRATGTVRWWRTPCGPWPSDGSAGTRRQAGPAIGGSDHPSDQGTWRGDYTDNWHDYLIGNLLLREANALQADPAEVRP
jgi:serine/threonine protein kinase